jgi:menaquinone-dependent protoporphyrinogen oxidase
MAGKVLVAYATKYGATEGIAEKIGVVLGEEGFDVEVISSEKISDLSPYEAVVIGSGVYIGRWRKEAAKFLKVYEKDLKQKKVWLFSSGPTGEGDPEAQLNGWTFPEGLKETAASIGPVDSTIFSGSIDKEKLKGLEKWMLKKVEAGIGDFRDWEAIEAWARSIAQELKK